MEEKYLTAIIIYKRFHRVKSAAKYRNIKNSVAALQRFEKFVSEKFPDWECINYYGKKSKKFVFKRRNNAGIS